MTRSDPVRGLGRGDANGDYVKAEPNPGPSVAHAYDCTHDPCRCVATKRRAIYLRVDQIRTLDHWCELVRASFKAPVYLVGSVLYRADWRDVDVRVVLPDVNVDEIPMEPLDLNMLLSRWGQEMTGLPIDCQVQTESEHAHKSRIHRANPRGVVEFRRKEAHRG